MSNNNLINSIPQNELSVFLDKIADLYRQHQDVAAICHDLIPHIEQQNACQRKTEVLSSIRNELESCLTSIKNNIFIEVRALMRDYLKPQP